MRRLSRRAFLKESPFLDSSLIASSRISRFSPCAFVVGCRLRMGTTPVPESVIAPATSLALA